MPVFAIICPAAAGASYRGLSAGAVTDGLARCPSFKRIASVADRRVIIFMPQPALYGHDSTSEWEPIPFADSPSGRSCSILPDHHITQEGGV